MQATGTRVYATEQERRRVEAVVETLTHMRQRGGTVAEVAHDARNVVTALALYCDLLEEPGVLAEGYGHYASELRLLAAASRKLVEKLVMLDERENDDLGELCLRAGLGAGLASGQAARQPAADLAQRLPNDPIENLQDDLLAIRNLLDAMAGLAISVSVRTEGGARGVRLSSEDLTRVLVNLVKNAAEAMRRAGQIEITLKERPDADGNPASVVLTVEDTGPGIAAENIERLFEAGFTTHPAGADGEGDGGWPATHRGLGLAITRSVIETAGGGIHAANREGGGALFEIELPIRAR
jgi:signal transduction histidine kinase